MAEVKSRLLPATQAADPDEAKDRRLSRQEVDEWLDYFGVDREPPEDGPPKA